MFYSVHGYTGYGYTDTKVESRCLRSVPLASPAHGTQESIASFHYEERIIILVLWEIKPRLKLNSILASWLRRLADTEIVKHLYLLWKVRRCCLRRKRKGPSWNKYNCVLRSSLFSSATSVLCFSYTYQGQKYYKLCHSELRVVLKNINASFR